VDRTFFEDVFYRLLKSHTKLQINRSFWIGKRNIDIFVPAIIAEPKGGIQRLKGLAIEIDGPIHNEEHKMRRDESKFQMLDELSIGSVVIQNHSFDNPTVAKIIRDISSYRNPDFRSKRRLLRSIYIRTIIANKDLCSERNLYQSKSLLQALREI
jgi:hypothetical protein